MLEIEHFRHFLVKVHAGGIGKRLACLAENSPSSQLMDELAYPLNVFCAPASAAGSKLWGWDSLVRRSWSLPVKAVPPVVL
jgi:hypothetical protein